MQFDLMISLEEQERRAIARRFVFDGLPGQARQ
jgi:hypothetical protein